MSWFTCYRQLNITYEFSWLNKSNSSTIEDMKNLSTTMNYTALITPQTKFQLPPVKDEQKTFIFSEFVQHREVQNFGAEYFKSSHNHSLEILIS